jgi:hypothetical protein
MTHEGEPRSRFGGISAMLAEQDVCPQCGEEHSESFFGLRAARRRECPNVLMGAFPILTPPEPSRAAAAVHRALGSERGPVPASPSVLPGAKPLLGRKSSHLTVPWPMPMETDEFL